MRVGFLSGLFLVVTCLSGWLPAQVPPRRLPTTRVLPYHDDAALHDIQFVGTQAGWAVGDHGVIWKTVDGGRTWSLKSAGVTCSLRSVRFLTDKLGWIVGGGTEPYTRQSFGVIFATKDGGESWIRLGKSLLPPLHYVQFFGLDEGVAVGEASATHPTGIVTTTDGGKTWKPLKGKRTAGWRAADFLQFDVGAVGGGNGAIQLIGGNRLLATQAGNYGRRSIAGIELGQDHKGWMVGDGGLINHTENGGVSWAPPTGKLPQAVRDVANFRCVSSQGAKAWIAGSPGSVIWHTADGGTTWRPQYTGSTVPLNAIEFTSKTQGWAVGELGVVLATTDGGTTWNAVRGQGRRAALLAIMPRPSRVSFPLVAKLGGDLGYRTTVWLPTRPDADAFKAGDGTHADRCLSEAVVKAGGHAAEFSWRYALDTPDLAHLQQQLLTDWKARAEGRFRELFLSELVARIRTWRPNVIVLEAPSEYDAVATVLQQAVEQAVRQAGDATRFIEHQEAAGLSAWKVDRVFIRQPAGSAGQATIDPHEFLPRLASSAQLTASHAESRLWELSAQTTVQEAYRVTFDREGNAAAVRDFFSGIVLNPGSEARRSLRQVDPATQDAQRVVFRRQRNFQAYAERMLDDPRKANQVIAELRQLTSGMAQSQAAQQLLLLAGDYRRQSRFDLGEATLVELVQRFPHQPAAHDAMRWLVQFWSAMEPAWQRSRATQVQGIQSTPDSTAALTRIQQAWHAAVQRARGQEPEEVSQEPDPVKLVSHAGGLQVKGTQPWRTRAVRDWHDQAVQLASLLRISSPATYQSAEIQFPLASLMRQRQLPQISDRVYRRFEADTDGDTWKTTAAAELWLNQPTTKAPKSIARCRRTTEPPFLDGLLSDPCWQAAKIVPLEDPQALAGSVSTSGAFVMFSYDKEYLYYAASLPRSASLKYEPIKLAGRKHDGELLGHDRVRLGIDVDRDYTTSYTLEIDQRGQTADACWNDSAWNPKWHVMVADDDKSWRIEAAIPWKELVPAAPLRGDIWALGVSRVMPAVGRHTWPSALPKLERTAAFGLLRFE